MKLFFCLKGDKSRCAQYDNTNKYWTLIHLFVKLKDQTNCQYALKINILVLWLYFNIQYFVIRRKILLTPWSHVKEHLNNASMARRYGINNLPSRVIKGTIWKSCAIHIFVGRYWWISVIVSFFQSMHVNNFERSFPLRLRNLNDRVRHESKH